MASYTLYPPILDNISPAFLKDGSCRVYFSLSKYSSSTDAIKGIQIAVVNKTTNKNVVNTTVNDTKLKRYRSSGIIILNQSINFDSDNNLYYVDILKDDIKNGWTEGTFYKIQIRLSSVVYSSGNIVSWLQNNASNFSEWSTYCTTKAISKPYVTIPIFQYDSSTIETGAEKHYSMNISTLEVDASFNINTVSSEVLYSYQMDLLNVDGETIETSDIIYSNSFIDYSKMYYVFKTELQDQTSYTLRISYTTKNKYSDSIDIEFKVMQTKREDIYYLYVKTLEEYEQGSSAEHSHLQILNSIQKENEEGRIGYKLYVKDNEDNPVSHTVTGVFCVRRTDSDSNFTLWSDIKIINCIGVNIDTLDWFYDYTAESGKWYRYGIQQLVSGQVRGQLNVNEDTSPIKREFEYSYLLGENNRQLKLKFNNTLSSYAYTISEGKTDTIGSKYPFITRAGNGYYRTLPLGGLISFEMDDENVFSNDLDLYKYSNVVDLYKEDRKDNNWLGFAPRDFTREKDFRDKVLAFLQDGKPKLFKSPTEGNILVRLMGVSLQPEQTLNRLIYSFSATAYEIDEANLENYNTYGLNVLDEPSDLIYDDTEYHVGQIIGIYKPGVNIIDDIFNKYTLGGYNINNQVKDLTTVTDLRVTFSLDDDGSPYWATDIEIATGYTKKGYQMEFNGNKISISAVDSGATIYNFDTIEFKENDTLVLKYEAKIEVDFIYKYTNHPVETNNVCNVYTYTYGASQIDLTNVEENTNLYNIIREKHYYKDDNVLKEIMNLEWTCIEAPQGSVFKMATVNDPDQSGTEVVMNDTLVFNVQGLGGLSVLKYVGSSTADRIIVDYVYLLKDERSA